MDSKHDVVSIVVSPLNELEFVFVMDNRDHLVPMDEVLSPIKVMLQPREVIRF